MPTETLYNTPMPNPTGGPLGLRWDRAHGCGKQDLQRCDRRHFSAGGTPTDIPWLIGFGISWAARIDFISAMSSGTLITGMGVHGVNHPVGWGVHIRFVFWIGIGHAGT